MLVSAAPLDSTYHKYATNGGWERLHVPPRELYVLTKFFPTLAPLCPTKLNCTGECQVNGGNAGIHAALEAKKGNFWNGWPCLPPAWSLSSLSNTHCLRRLRTMQSVCKRVGQEQKLPQSWAKLIWGQSIFWNIASLVQEMWLNSLIAGEI